MCCQEQEGSYAWCKGKVRKRQGDLLSCSTRIKITIQTIFRSFVLIYSSWTPPITAPPAREASPAIPTKAAAASTARTSPAP